MVPHQRLIDYQDSLDDTALEWLRVRVWIEAGRAQRFTVQYETILDSKRLPVVRYDTAHGAPHRDRLNRRGEEIAKDFLSESLTLGEALVHAERDLRLNWLYYLDEYLRYRP